MGSTVEGDVTVTWIDHATVLLRGSSHVMIDPYGAAIRGTYNEPDVFVVTHAHPDHYDPDYINANTTDDTVVLAHVSCDIGELECEARLMEPGDTEVVDGVEVTAVEAYNDHRFRNPGEPFHPRGSGMGVLVELDDSTFYHAGDTDHIPEMDSLRSTAIDCAFLPIGGTYTMDVEEAAGAATSIGPDEIIPIHYDMIENTAADAGEFRRLVRQQADGIEVTILGPED